MKKKIVFLLTALSLVLAGCSDKADFEFAGWPEEEENPSNPGGDDTPPTTDEDETPPSTEVGPYDGERADDIADAGVVGTDEDLYYELNTFDKKVKIVYNGSTATVENDNSKIITHVDGAHVVVDMLTGSVKNVEIEVSGSTDKGSLKLYGDKKYLLTLNGAEITSDRGPAINNQCKKRVFVHLADNSVNRLTDAAVYTDDSYYPDGVTADDEDRKGCMFSEGHLIFSGAGVLVVNGRQKHAIATDNSFIMRPGVTIVVEDAAKNGLQVKGDAADGSGIVMLGGLVHATVTSEAGKCLKTDQNVAVSGGRLLLATSGNAFYDADARDTSSASGIKADGNIEITGGEIVIDSRGSGGKGISADGSIRFAGGKTTVTTSGGKFIYNTSQGLESSPKGVKAEGDIVVEDGEISISVTGKSDGSEGLESKSSISISGGSLSVWAYDDAINAATAVNISGGRIYAYAEHNDGIDSNGTLTISGGTVIASGSSVPEQSFDCDYSSNFTVTGGTLVGIAGSSLAPSSTLSTQRSVIYNGISVTKDSVLAIADASGNPIMVYRLPRTLANGTSLFFSSSDLTAGSTYTVYKDVTVGGAVEEWGGLYGKVSWSGGTEVGTFTSNSIVTTVGSSGGPGGGPGGGGPGGRP